MTRQRSSLEPRNQYSSVTDWTFVLQDQAVANVVYAFANKVFSHIISTEDGCIGNYQGYRFRLAPESGDEQVVTVWKPREMVNQKELETILSLLNTVKTHQSKTSSGYPQASV